MKQILYKLFEHQYLGRDEARTILQNIAQGKYNDVQVASLITVFLMRNISVEELCGFRDALLEMRVPVDLSEFSPIDIVGTGGDGRYSGGETWQLWSNFSQWRQQCNGTAWCQIHK